MSSTDRQNRLLLAEDWTKIYQSFAEKKNNGLLKDKSFLVTGKLNGISRAEVKSLIEENSGKVMTLTL